MDNKGQITIEAIFIIGFLTVLLLIATIPLSLDIKSGSEDTSKAVEVRSNLDFISGIIETCQAEGPGTVKNYYFISNYKDMFIQTDGDSIVYGAGWSNSTEIPSGLIPSGSFGTLSRDIKGMTPSGVNSSLTITDTAKGRWNVRVEHLTSAGLNPTLNIGSSLINGDTINITIK